MRFEIVFDDELDFRISIGHRGWVASQFSGEYTFVEAVLAQGAFFWIAA